MSRYYGSTAYAYDALPQEGVPERQAVRLEVIEGGGLDAQARRAVSPGFVRIVRRAMLAFALIAVLGAVRVAMTTQTVVLLNNNLALRSDIAAAEQVNSDLKIERSVLSSSTRITRIATQNYGMVYAQNRDRIALPAMVMPGVMDEDAQVDGEDAPSDDEATPVEGEAEPSDAEADVDAEAEVEGEQFEPTEDEQLEPTEAEPLSQA